MRTVVIILLMTVGTITVIGVYPNNSSNSSAAQSVQNPMRVRIVPQFNRVLGRFTGYKNIEVLSMADNLNIQSITLNRENCKSTGLIKEEVTSMDSDKDESEGWKLLYNHYDALNRPYTKVWGRMEGTTLKYGELKEIETNCQEILEMTIKTDQGEFRY